jgi:hypothetical protein
LSRVEVKARKGRTMDWPGYAGWDAVLVKQEEADMLRKNFGIPFKFPEDINTFVFERNIIKKVKKTNKRRKIVQKNKK